MCVKVLILENTFLHFLRIIVNKLLPDIWILCKSYTISIYYVHFKTGTLFLHFILILSYEGNTGEIHGFHFERAEG